MPRFEQLVETSVDSAEVAWLVSKRAAAVRSRDAEYLSSRYAPCVLTFGIAPPLGARADEANRVEWLRRWFDGLDGRIDYVVHDLTVSVGGDLAFCHGIASFGARRGGRRRSAVRLETTLGLRRANGVWLVEAERVRVVE
jgi:ketosteroid isomerase-like protein